MTQRRRPTCAVCGRRVRPGEGMYYAGRLIHRRCHGMAKIWRHRLLRH